MRISNPLQMNDWNIKKFLIVIVSFQILVLGTIGMDLIGLKIPILRSVVCFIYLSFIPGILALRVLKLHKLNLIENLVYAVGLSLSILVFIGLLASIFCPMVGVLKPFSIIPLTIFTTFMIFFLCILSYITDHNFSDPSYIDLKDILCVPALFLYLIPILTILGTYFVNFHQNNFLLMIVIYLISLIVLLIGFTYIHEKFYSLAIFSMTISLLSQRSLISMYLWGSDVHYELYFADLVKMNSIWDFSIFSNFNSMLSIVILAPMYSIITDLNLTWVFKILYPILFSLLPLGLYRLFQKQTNSIISFFACFFFISYFSFYTEMLVLARQEIAELFLLLVILLIVDENMDKTKKSFLIVIFSMSLVLSHYGLSYIYMLSLIPVTLFFVLCSIFNKPKFLNLINNKCAFLKNSYMFKQEVSSKITINYFLLYTTFTLFWYMYTSNSSLISTILKVAKEISNKIIEEFLSPDSSQGLYLILKESNSPLNVIFKDLHLMNQIFIFLGVMCVFLDKRLFKFNKNYVAYSIVYLLICLSGIFIPHFSNALNTTRLYHISLIFLAPFCIIGWILFLERVNIKLFKVPANKFVYKSLSIFFVIFLLFNVGVIFGFTDKPNSVALSLNKLKESNDKTVQIGFYGGYDPEQNVFSNIWFSKNTLKKNIVVYSGKIHVPQIVGYGMIPYENIFELSPSTKVKHNSYTYLGYLNVMKGVITSWSTVYLERTSYYDIKQIYPIVNTQNCIYSNGGSKIYFKS